MKKLGWTEKGMKKAPGYPGASVLDFICSAVVAVLAVEAPALADHHFNRALCAGELSFFLVPQCQALQDEIKSV